MSQPYVPPRPVGVIALPYLTLPYVTLPYLNLPPMQFYLGMWPL
jgi:hypothetical protein